MHITDVAAAVARTRATFGDAVCPAFDAAPDLAHFIVPDGSATFRFEPATDAAARMARDGGVRHALDGIGRLADDVLGSPDSARGRGLRSVVLSQRDEQYAANMLLYLNRTRSGEVVTPFVFPGEDATEASSLAVRSWRRGTEGSAAAYHGASSTLLVGPSALPSIVGMARPEHVWQGSHVLRHEFAHVEQFASEQAAARADRLVGLREGSAERVANIPAERERVLAAFDVSVPTRRVGAFRRVQHDDRSPFVAARTSGAYEGYLRRTVEAARFAGVASGAGDAARYAQSPVDLARELGEAVVRRHHAQGVDADVVASRIASWVESGGRRDVSSILHG